MASTYEQRQQEFAKRYEDFEHADIVRLVTATGNWLERLLLEPAAVHHAMTALYAAVAGEAASLNGDADWRELWESSSSDFGLLRTSQYLVSLNAFAFWGLRPDFECFDGPADADLPVSIGRFVAVGRALLDSVPEGWGAIGDVEKTVLAAEGRLRIDTGRGVKPEQLAALARVSLKTIKNLLTPSAGASELSLDERGEIPAAPALRWLGSREDFKDSLWRSAPEGAPLNSKPTFSEHLGEVLFVPVARDQSWFDPVRCKRAQGYTIGPKGHEIAVSDYREALERLTRMPVPHWRRPNEKGNWGIVTGVGWQRKPVSEIAKEDIENGAGR
jgi:hypothetical protein